MPDNSHGSNGVAISEDGARLYSVSRNGGLYASADSGATWVARPPQAAATYWGLVACSPNGLIVTAGAYVTAYGESPSGANIYVSSDGGLTWATRTPPPGQGIGWWGPFAQSADGQRMVAGNNQGLVFTSGTAGVTWTPRTIPGFGSNSGLALASSADGAMFVAAYTSAPRRSRARSSRARECVPGLLRTRTAQR